MFWAFSDALAAPWHAEGLLPVLGETGGSLQSPLCVLRSPPTPVRAAGRALGLPYVSRPCAAVVASAPTASSPARPPRNSASPRCCVVDGAASRGGPLSAPVGPDAFVFMSKKRRSVGAPEGVHRCLSSGSAGLRPRPGSLLYPSPRRARPDDGDAGWTRSPPPFHPPPRQRLYGFF